MELKLWENEIPYYKEEVETPNLMTTYLLETDKPLPCVVVFPGGGYRARAPHEGGPFAEYFNSQGLHAVVVEYRVAPNQHPAPLADAQRAIRLVRHHAKEWNVDPDKIVVCGSSAGGHLSASALIFPETYPETPTDEIDTLDCRPNGAVLAYPVTNVGVEMGHVGTGLRLLGEERYLKQGNMVCLAQYVTDKTPPVFMFHTSDDQTVNVKNSLLFGAALRDHNVPFEMHIFPHGVHGVGVADNDPVMHQWIRLAADWIKRTI